MGVKSIYLREIRGGTIMKKVVLAMVLVAMLISVVGCSKAKPEEAVSTYFDAFQKQDVETMETVVIASSTQEAVENNEAEDDTEYVKYFEDYLKNNAEKMTYKVIDSEVDEDKAIVTVDCRYINGGPLLKATIGEVFQKIIGMAFAGIEMSEEETNQMFLSTMKEQSKTIGETYKEITIKIDCVKQDGKWFIAEVSDEMSDILTSGFTSVGKELDSIGEEENSTSEDPADVLWEINDYVIGDLWNDGFCEISYYLEDGQGSYGQEIDIEFTKSQLERAMNKKADYDKYITSLDNHYLDIKEVWNKLSSEIDLLYQQVQSGATSLNTDLFKQYSDAFSDMVYEL